MLYTIYNLQGPVATRLKFVTPPGQGYLFQGYLCIYPRDEARQRVKTAQHIRGEIVSICFVTENMLVGKVKQIA